MVSLSGAGQSNKSLIVDPIPSGGGIINGGAKLSFDSMKRPVINYHKSDENGNMQLYVARFEKSKWVRHQLTKWEKPVKFSGGGAMPWIGISVSGLSLVESGLLTLTWRHKDYGRGRMVLDEETLLPIDRKIPSGRKKHPKGLDKVRSDFKGMRIKRASDIGSPGEEGVRYMLQWETLGANHDRPRKGELPEPSMLELIEIRE